MPVVAGVLRDGDGRLLLQRRPPGKRHAGLWEFPGGKVEPGENPRAALVRELAEELGIDLADDALRPAGFAEAAAGGGEPAIVILLYTVGSFSGRPTARGGAEAGWFTPAQAAELPLPPLDRALLAQLRGGER
ncbi:MAG: (deoxy)nucleoside triphosphate pyrophosphohydrolase [Cypionkella sp.]